jgi:ATP-binding cassette subfamily B protein
MAVNLVQRGAASMARINELFRQRPAIAGPAAPATAARAAAGGGIRPVWFRYPGDTARGWALEDVSFQVAAGRSLAIVGATGAGSPSGGHARPHL